MLYAPITRKTVPFSGFTLVEMIVAVGIFAIVITLASGSYLTMMSANRQAQAVATGINNLSFGLEVMTRDIRTGHNYPIGGSPSDTFTFKNSTGHTTQYSLVNGVLLRSIDSGAAIPLTDSSVTITNLRFYWFDTQTQAQGNTGQARVIVTITGQVPVDAKNPAIPFSVETGATMRTIDL